MGALIVQPWQPAFCLISHWRLPLSFYKPASVRPIIRCLCKANGLVSIIVANRFVPMRFTVEYEVRQFDPASW
jgi:hypothetical protein